MVHDEDHIILDVLNTKVGKIKGRIGFIDEKSAKFFGSLIEDGQVAKYENFHKYQLLLGYEIPPGKIREISSNCNDDAFILLVNKNRQGLQQLGSSKKISRDSFTKVIDKLKLTILFAEPVGKPSRLVNADDSNVLIRFINLILNKVGWFIPASKLWSPTLIVLFKNSKNVNSHKYVSELSIKRRLYRLRQRTITYINNHKISEYIFTAKTFWWRIEPYIREMFLINYFQFKKINIPLFINDNKIPLLISMTYLEVGGVERVMLNIIKGLPRDKFNITLITTFESKHPWHSEFEPHVDRIIHTTSVLPFHLFSNKWRRKFIEKLVISNKMSEMLITNSQTAYDALPMIKKSIPSLNVFDILHTHGTPIDDDAYLKTSLPYDKFLTKRIVIDEYLKDYYVRKYGINPNKILVIYNGLSAQDVNRKVDVERGRKLINLDKNDESIVSISYIGRLDSDKSPLRLVYIAKLLKEHNVPSRLVICGSGAMEKEMKDLAKQFLLDDDDILFLGYVDNPIDIAAASTATILVSDSEGIPMSILESMLVETPCIAPRVGGIPEIIDNETEGYLVDINGLNEDNKVNNFVMAIERLQTLEKSNYESMIKAAKGKIKLKFCSMADEYNRLLLESNIGDRF